MESQRKKERVAIGKNRSTELKRPLCYMIAFASRMLLWSFHLPEDFQIVTTQEDRLMYLKASVYDCDLTTVDS